MNKYFSEFPAYTCVHTAQEIFFDLPHGEGTLLAHVQLPDNHGPQGLTQPIDSLLPPGCSLQL